jgi:hypothetical protein
MSESSRRAYSGVGFFVSEQRRQFVHRVGRTNLDQAQTAERPQWCRRVRATAPGRFELYVSDSCAKNVFVVAIGGEKSFDDGGLSGAALVSLHRVQHEAMKGRDQIRSEFVIFNVSNDLRRPGHDQADLAHQVLSQLFASLGSIRFFAEPGEFGEPIFY